MQHDGVTRRAFGCGLLCSGIAAGTAGCVSTNPATGGSSFTGHYSLEDDIAIGAAEHPKLVKAFGGEYRNPRLQSYVADVGRAVAGRSEMPHLPYRFTIVNSPIVNAFALPGGYVYVSRGLLALASSEAELASVLGHEVGHVVARHTAQRLTRAELLTAGQILLGVLGAATGAPTGVASDLLQQGGVAYIQSFSREQEFEADLLGTRYMVGAGYDPQAVVSFLKTLREHSQLEARMRCLPPGTVDQYNIMATHPRPIDRVQRAVEAAAAVPASNPRIGRRNHLEKIDGMLFGDSPREGVIDGRRFLHPDLRFTFQVPSGFRIANTPRAVVARNCGNATVAFDADEVGRSVSMTGYIADEWAPLLRGLDFRAGSLEAITVNGLEGATVAGYTDSDVGLLDVRLVAIRFDRARVYRFWLIAPRRDMGALERQYHATVHSFRRLSREEAARVRPLLLLVVPAAPGDRADALAYQLPFGPYNEAVFRVLNDLGPRQQLPASGYFKTLIKAPA